MMSRSPWFSESSSHLITNFGIEIGATYWRYLRLDRMYVNGT
jgi:hypothetical protein